MELPSILLPNPQLCRENKIYKSRAIELSLESIKLCETAISGAIQNRMNCLRQRQINMSKKIDCILHYLDSIQDGEELSKE